MHSFMSTVQESYYYLSIPSDQLNPASSGCYDADDASYKSQ